MVHSGCCYTHVGSPTFPQGQGRDNVIGIATRYGMEGPGIEFR